MPEEVKSRRLSEIIALQNELGHASNLRDVGREFEVLVEGESKRDKNQLSGRTSQNKVVVFDRGDHKVGDYVKVRITAVRLRRFSAPCCKCGIGGGFACFRPGRVPVPEMKKLIN